MPHGFEYVVRPFQAPGSLGNVIIPGTPARTQEVAHITWGAVGTMPSTKLLNPSTVVDTNKEELTEQDRDSDIIRITGNDPENWVDVARANKVRLTKQTTNSDQKLNTDFYTGGMTFDPQLDPYLKNFSALAKTPGPMGVVWNMKNA